MKKYFAEILAILLLLCCFCGCKNDESDILASDPKGTDIVASIGDETVTYSLYRAAYDSYLEYMSLIGGTITGEAELETFQDMILDYLVMDMMALYNAKADGFVLSDEEIAKATEQAESELEDVYDEYMDTARQDHEEDSSKTVQEYFDEYIAALSEYYIGERLNFDEYSARYTDEMIRSYTIEGYKEFVCRDFKVSESDIAEWYSEQFDTDKSAYDENPGQYKFDAEYYEMYFGLQFDACPQTYIPEGYSRIMDIVIYPEGELSEEYDEKNKRMNEIYRECSELTFEDALNDNDVNADRIAELLAEYRRLDAECTALYERFTEDVQEKMDAAYAELEAGIPFTEVMLKYTEDPAVIGEDGEGGCETFRTKGQLISTVHDCGEYDWSSNIKEIFGMLEPGEYSSVFSDDDGSFHIIYYVSDEPAGEVGVNAIHDEIMSIVKATNDEAAWNELMETWLDDRNIVRNMELVRSVGRDSLEGEIND